ncbi:MAG TPA: hypothetical protein VJ735_09340, partial [Actinomycetes bacterium]|nr:hypothetical protein [Actinomycetes bacterium]
ATARAGGLDVLPPVLQQEVFDEAQQALDAVGVGDLRAAAAEALEALEQIGKEPWAHGQKWADCRPVWKATLALRAAIAQADGGPPPQEGGQE